MTLLGDSAPGPDGIAYAAFAGCMHACMHAQFILYSVYIVWLYSGFTPPFFNVAFLWLLPKNDPPDGIFKPSDTRPLSGANADAKILAKCLALPINQIIDGWAVWVQRGFIRGRECGRN